ncbi:unnamed protein product [Choristocarpus tenellus]
MGNHLHYCGTYRPEEAVSIIDKWCLQRGGDCVMTRAYHQNLYHRRMAFGFTQFWLLICFLIYQGQRQCTEALQHRRLVIFRGRSRHTVGFEPLAKFELPSLEFTAAVEGVVHGEGKNGTRPRGHQPSLVFHPSLGSESFQWVSSRHSDITLSRAAGRSVLVHGLYEVWGYGESPEAATADAFRSGRISLDFYGAGWEVGAMSFGRPQLTREEEEELVRGPLRVVDHINGQRDRHANSERHLLLVEDLCPSSPSLASQDWARSRGEKVLRKSEGSSQSNRNCQKQYFICRVLQMGPVVGGRKVLGMTYRRPRSGVLKTLALSGRECRGPTAIEAEISLIMANLARVQPGSLVYDPFCGSCSLLLPAAYMGALTVGSDIAGPASVTSVSSEMRMLKGPDLSRHEPTSVPGDLLGVDAKQKGVNRDTHDLWAIHRDFRRLDLVAPRLMKADIADKDSPLCIQGYYDAIICDPPYHIKEQVVHSSELALGNQLEDNPIVRVAGGKDAQLLVEAEAVGGETVIPRSLSLGTPSIWAAGEGEVAIEEARGLVEQVVMHLMDLAGEVLKLGGRLTFFFPLRGEQARLDHFPQELGERLFCQGGSLSLKIAIKQRQTSPNMCRWLLVLEKMC